MAITPLAGAKPVAVEATTRVATRRALHVTASSVPVARPVQAAPAPAKAVAVAVAAAGGGWLAGAAAAAPALAVGEAVAAAGSGNVLLDYPILTGAAVLLGVGGLLLGLSSRKETTAGTSAAAAYEAVCADPRTLLLDVRPLAIIKEEGVFDLKEAGKKALTVTYATFDDDGKPELDERFVANLQALPQVASDNIIIVADSDGKLAAKAAAAVAVAEVVTAKVYYIRGGMEGPGGWKESELPWKPYRAFELPSVSLPQLDLQATVQAIKDTYEKNPEVVNTALAAVGIAAIGGIVVAEAETVLQIVGLVGAARLALSGKERDNVLAAIKAFLPGSKAEEAAPAPARVSGSTYTVTADEQVVEAPQPPQQQATLVPSPAPAAEAEPAKGADPAALAAALAAAGLSSPASTSMEEQPVVVVAEAAAAAAEPEAAAPVVVVAAVEAEAAAPEPEAAASVVVLAEAAAPEAAPEPPLAEEVVVAAVVEEEVPQPAPAPAPVVEAVAEAAPPAPEASTSTSSTSAEEAPRAPVAGNGASAPAPSASAEAAAPVEEANGPAAVAGNVPAGAAKAPPAAAGTAVKPPEVVKVMA